MTKANVSYDSTYVRNSYTFIYVSYTYIPNLKVIISGVCIWGMIRKRQYLFDVSYSCNVSMFVYIIYNNNFYIYIITENTSMILKTNKKLRVAPKESKDGEKAVIGAGHQVKG